MSREEFQTAEVLRLLGKDWNCYSIAAPVTQDAEGPEGSTVTEGAVLTYLKALGWLQHWSSVTTAGSTVMRSLVCKALSLGRKDRRKYVKKGDVETLAQLCGLSARSADTLGRKVRQEPVRGSPPELSILCGFLRLVFTG